MVATRESAQLAERLLFDTIAKQNINGDQLTIHSDNGSSMASKPVAFLLADFGVTKSHSRPHVSNDNPFSEAKFKTLKYRPEFPARFHSLEQARTFCTDFYSWSNHDHRHSGIGMHTPSNLHHTRTRHPRRSSSRPHDRLHGPPETLRAATPAATNVSDHLLDQRTRERNGELNEHLKKLTHHG